MGFAALVAFAVALGVAFAVTFGFGALDAAKEVGIDPITRTDVAKDMAPRDSNFPKDLAD